MTMDKLFHDFYVQPMLQVYIETIALYLIWTIMAALLRGRARRYLARVVVVLSLILILCFTVFGRGVFLFLRLQ